MKLRLDLAAVARVALGLAAIAYALWFPGEVIDAALRVGAYEACQQLVDVVAGARAQTCERPLSTDWHWVGGGAWVLYAAHGIGVAAIYRFLVHASVLRPKGAPPPVVH